MKTKSWKKYMCLMGISLMMMPAVCAMQTAEGGNGDNPVKKTRSTTFFSGPALRPGRLSMDAVCILFRICMTDR